MIDWIADAGYKRSRVFRSERAPMHLLARSKSAGVHVVSAPATSGSFKHLRRRSQPLLGRAKTVGAAPITEHIAATDLQKSFRAHRELSRFRAMRNSVMKLQAGWRGTTARQKIKELRMSAILLQGRISRWVHRRVQAAIKLQSAWRGRRARLEFHKLRFAAMKMQRVMRGACARLTARMRRRTNHEHDQKLIALVDQSQRVALALLRRRRRVSASLVMLGVACMSPAAAFLLTAAAGASSMAPSDAWPLLAWTQPLLGAGTGETDLSNPQPSPRMLPHAPRPPVQRPR